MTVKTKKIIMVELVETNVFSRWHCTVCDGCTNPVSVLAEGKDGKRAIRVCEQCLEAAEIDKRLAATAAAHEWSRSSSLSNGHWMQQSQRICYHVFDQVEPTRSPWPRLFRPSTPSMPEDVDARGSSSGRAGCA
jgi:hypothetical protein